jgi:hypothetical protein
MYSRLGSSLEQPYTITNGIYNKEHFEALCKMSERKKIKQLVSEQKVEKNEQKLPPQDESGIQSETQIKIPRGSTSHSEIDVSVISIELPENMPESRPREAAGLQQDEVPYKKYELTDTTLSEEEAALKKKEEQRKNPEMVGISETLSEKGNKIRNLHLKIAKFKSRRLTERISHAEKTASEKADLYHSDNIKSISETLKVTSPDSITTIKQKVVKEGITAIVDVEVQEYKLTYTDSSGETKTETLRISNEGIPPPSDLVGELGQRYKKEFEQKIKNSFFKKLNDEKSAHYNKLANLERDKIDFYEAQLELNDLTYTSKSKDLMEEEKKIQEIIDKAKGQNQDFEQGDLYKYEMLADEAIMFSAGLDDNFFEHQETDVEEVSFGEGEDEQIYLKIFVDGKYEYYEKNDTIHETHEDWSNKDYKKYTLEEINEKFGIDPGADEQGRVAPEELTAAKDYIKSFFDDKIGVEKEYTMSNLIDKFLGKKIDPLPDIDKIYGTNAIEIKKKLEELENLINTHDIDLSGEIVATESAKSIKIDENFISNLIDRITTEIKVSTEGGEKTTISELRASLLEKIETPEQKTELGISDKDPTLEEQITESKEKCNLQNFSNFELINKEKFINYNFSNFNVFKIILFLFLFLFLINYYFILV